MKVITKMNNAEVVLISTSKFSLGVSLLLLKNEMKNFELTNLALLPGTLPTHKALDVLMRRRQRSFIKFLLDINI